MPESKLTLWQKGEKVVTRLYGETIKGMGIMDGGCIVLWLEWADRGPAQVPSTSPAIWRSISSKLSYLSVIVMVVGTAVIILPDL